MAASKDLLEALVGLVNAIEDASTDAFDQIDLSRPEFVKAKEAIAKAVWDAE